MSEPDNNNAALEQDISAKELMEKFGLNEEQAAKLAAALPALCKELMGQGQRGPAPQRYPYPYPTPKRQDGTEIPAEANDALEEMAEALQIVLNDKELTGFLQAKLARRLQPGVDAMLAANPELAKAIKIKQDSVRKIPRVDSVMMDMVEDSIKLEDGILTADCVATAAMVQDYNGKKVLKCPDELRKAAQFARQLPVTDTHPDDGLVTSQDEIKGWTTPLTYDEDKKRLGCSVQITDGALIKKVQDGKKDVSIGFFCDIEEKEGEFKGEKYSQIQRNIVLNHLAAGIDNGRCPTGICGIGQDEADPAPAAPAAEPEPEPDAGPRTEEERAMAHFKLSKEEWDKLSAEEKQKLIEKLPPKGEGKEAEPMDAKKYKCPKCGNEQTKAGPCEKCETEVEEVKVEETKEEPMDKCAPKTPEELKKEEEKPKDEVPPPEILKPEEQAADLAKLKDEAYGDDEEKLALVDSIMDYSPPHNREHYMNKSKQDLKDTLTLLRAKADSGGPTPKSRSKPANKDEAYSRLQEDWSKR